MFVTNWISTTKIQKISEITNFFRHYFLSRTEVEDCIPVEHHRSRVLADSQMGKEVQQLSENGIGLCFHVESLHLAL